MKQVIRVTSNECHNSYHTEALSLLSYGINKREYSVFNLWTHNTSGAKSRLIYSIPEAFPKNLFLTTEKFFSINTILFFIR